MMKQEMMLAPCYMITSPILTHEVKRISAHEDPTPDFFIEGEN